MGGRDKSNQMLASYIQIIEKKWYMKEFQHPLKFSVSNSCIIHQQMGGKFLMQMLFWKVIEQIIKQYHVSVRNIIN